MYLIDYHPHSRLSPDADHPLTELAGAAVRAGLSELCVTDHYDRLTLDGRWEEPYDWAPALEQYRQAAGQFAGRLTLRLGIEYGGAPFDPEYARAMLARPEVDFVIGSLHNRSPRAGGADFYCGPYDTPEQCYAALDDYFASMERLVELPDCYDVVGHIIYPLRYMPETITLDRYWGRIDAILRRVVETGRGIELNTYCGKTIAPWQGVLERYRAHGGERITVGSDAHAPERVGLGVKEAYALLAGCGFRYLSVYEKHTPRQIKL